MQICAISLDDFIQYRKPSMFIGFPHCSFKWEKVYKNGKEKYCQISELANARKEDVDIDELLITYVRSNLMEAIVCGGLEPFDSWKDLKHLLKHFRDVSEDDFVIYTGYNKDEIVDKVEQLKQYPNVIIKYGRFIPNSEKRYDDVLGITLASNNQYAEKISWLSEKNMLYYR